jgi:integrase/recombinase XerD
MFDQFIKERQYLTGVSPRTVDWYRESFKWLLTPCPTDSDLKAFVMRMREKGLKPSSCNNRIRAVNAYLKWSDSTLRIPKIKEPQLVLPTFPPEDIRMLLTCKPKYLYQQRLRCLLLFLADTGARISEALSVRWDDVDFDNMLVKLDGKGGRQRVVPFSFELRKALFVHRKAPGNFPLVFCTRDGNALDRRDMLRDAKRLFKRLGIVPPVRALHALRHTFALTYVRRGGSIFHLQKALGHSSLDMVRRYVNLTTHDLSATHRSPLTRP